MSDSPGKTLSSVSSDATASYDATNGVEDHECLTFSPKDTDNVYTNHDGFELIATVDEGDVSSSVFQFDDTSLSQYFTISTSLDDATASAEVTEPERSLTFSMSFDVEDVSTPPCLEADASLDHHTMLLTSSAKSPDQLEESPSHSGLISKQETEIEWTLSSEVEILETAEVQVAQVPKAEIAETPNVRNQQTLRAESTQFSEVQGPDVPSPEIPKLEIPQAPGLDSPQEKEIEVLRHGQDETAENGETKSSKSSQAETVHDVNNLQTIETVHEVNDLQTVEFSSLQNREVLTAQILKVESSKVSEIDSPNVYEIVNQQAPELERAENGNVESHGTEIMETVQVLEVDTKHSEKVDSTKRPESESSPDTEVDIHKAQEVESLQVSENIISQDSKVSSQTAEVESTQTVEVDRSQTLEIESPQTAAEENSQIAEVESSPTVEVESSQTAEVESLQTGEVESSPTAEAETPQTAEAETPQTAEAEIPQIAEGKIPETAEGKIPETAEGEILQTAEIESQRTIEVESSETTEVECQRTSEIESQQKAEVEKLQEDKIESPRTIEVEIPQTVETESPRTIEVKSPRTIEVESPQTLEIESPRTIEIESPQTLEIESPRIIEIESPQTLEIESPRTIEVKSPRTIEGEIPQTVEIESPRTIEIESPRTIEVKSPRTIEIESPRTIEVESPRTIEIESPRTIEVKSPRTIEIESPRTIEVKSPRTIEIESPRTIEIESPRTIEVEISQTVEMEGPRTLEIEGPRTLEIESPRTLEIEGPRTLEIESPRTLEIESLQKAEVESKRKAEVGNTELSENSGLNVSSQQTAAVSDDVKPFTFSDFEKSNIYEQQGDRESSNINNITVTRNINNFIVTSLADRTTSATSLPDYSRLISADRDKLEGYSTFTVSRSENESFASQNKTQSPILLAPYRPSYGRTYARASSVPPKSVSFLIPDLQDVDPAFGYSSQSHQPQNTRATQGSFKPQRYEYSDFMYTSSTLSDVAPLTVSHTFQSGNTWPQQPSSRSSAGRKITTITFDQSPLQTSQSTSRQPQQGSFAHNKTLPWTSTAATAYSPAISQRKPASFSTSLFTSLQQPQIQPRQVTASPSFTSITSSSWAPVFRPTRFDPGSGKKPDSSDMSGQRTSLFHLPGGVSSSVGEIWRPNAWQPGQRSSSSGHKPQPADDWQWRTETGQRRERTAPWTSQNESSRCEYSKFYQDKGQGQGQHGAERLHVFAPTKEVLPEARRYPQSHNQHGLGYDDDESSSFPASWRRKKNLYSDSACLYTPGTAKAEQADFHIGLPRSAVANLNPRGPEIPVSRGRRNVDWIHDGQSERSSEALDLDSDLSFQDEDERGIFSSRLAGSQQRFMSDTRTGKIPLTPERFENAHLSSDRHEHDILSPHTCFDIISDLKAHKGRGGRLFERRKERSDHFIVEGRDAKVHVPTARLEDLLSHPARHQTTPWEAALEHDGKVDAAFDHISDQDRSQNLIKDALPAPRPPPVAPSSFNLEGSPYLVKDKNFNRTAIGWTAGKEYSVVQPVHHVSPASQATPPTKSTSSSQPQEQQNDFDKIKAFWRANDESTYDVNPAHNWHQDQWSERKQKNWQPQRRDVLRSSHDDYEVDYTTDDRHFSRSRSYHSDRYDEAHQHGGYVVVDNKNWLEEYPSLAYKQPIIPGTDL